MEAFALVEMLTFLPSMFSVGGEYDITRFIATILQMVCIKHFCYVKQRYGCFHQVHHADQHAKSATVLHALDALPRYFVQLDTHYRDNASPCSLHIFKQPSLPPKFFTFFKCASGKYHKHGTTRVLTQASKSTLPWQRVLQLEAHIMAGAPHSIHLVKHCLLSLLSLSISLQNFDNADFF
ncbi:T. brucei spp.-specific protein [Trypanosoma brucei gambiense DAL972]|uniref:T. brucei spp.-specific protein n=1 Tax=Trypanosoma brucei gambiense (strain MHOM/CI/86/DAL972) TaxID=679716 RepID=C9ZIX7_TRYB9|nr:T. brucei spp.-specific protein [Trypanosoma brucei gambiense DAL972]CBH09344.1 T. brucei spp.-specific protein [Trypanosoma brucei gambiense DAL972]|eukprot:XP_011771650.1 T. brucei spp.-specific protein [Trypanosoma brucei gambiense DAL972]